MFNSQGVDTSDKKFGPSKYITYGIQDLKINKMEIKVASTGSKQVVFSVEGAPVEEAGFEGIDGARGPVGRITTMYMKPESEKDMVSIFGKISDALGVRDKLDQIKSDSLEDYVSKVSDVICGKFAKFVVSTEQYWDATKAKSRDSFRFPKYDFVEKIGVAESKLKFDKNNSYHFKPAVIPSTIGTPESATAVKADKSDLPF